MTTDDLIFLKKNSINLAKYSIKEQQPQKIFLNFFVYQIRIKTNDNQMVNNLSKTTKKTSKKLKSIPVNSN